MSVIGYHKTELLGIAAATWDRGSIGSASAQRYMEALAEGLTLLSQQNMAAYNATYNENEEPEIITADDIKRALMYCHPDQKQRGIRALSGMRYNLVSNNGKDFATADGLDWLLTLQTARISALEDQLSARSR